MKAMKKTLAVLLTLCMVISMLAVAAVTVSAEETGETTTITVGVISYLIDELGETGWQVHYWGGSATSDSDLSATGETIQRKDVYRFYSRNSRRRHRL